MKTRVANLLFKLAQRLDPHRPVVVTRPNGYEIRLAGIPLAQISPGMVQDTRYPSA